MGFSNKRTSGHITIGIEGVTSPGGVSTCAGVASAVSLNTIKDRIFDKKHEDDTIAEKSLNARCISTFRGKSEHLQLQIPGDEVIMYCIFSRDKHQAAFGNNDGSYIIERAAGS